MKNTKIWLAVTGVLLVILGIAGLYNPDLSADWLSILIGIAIIAIGLAHIFALCGIKKFEKVA